MKDKTRMYSLQILVLYFIINMSTEAESYSWERPGCHRVGHSRNISILGCPAFEVKTNACRGFCVSWSVPSNEELMIINPRQRITSVGQCCNIMDTEDVKVQVMCITGLRTLTFKSAKSCTCFHCKKI